MSRHSSRFSDPRDRKSRSEREESKREHLAKKARHALHMRNLGL